MDIPRPRLPVEVVERIIDAAALLPTCDADLTPKQTVIFTAKAAKYGSGYGKPLFMHLDEARSLVHTRWPGLEVVQPPRGSHVGPGPPSALLDAFFKQVVPCLPALRTLRTHVVPASFDPNTPRVIRWRRTLDSLPAHTIVDLELASVIFHRSRDFLAMIKALLSLRVLKCTQVAWGNHEWPPGWPVSRPHSLGLVELELRMSDWLLDLPATERVAWAGGIIATLHASMSTIEKLTLDEGALQLLCGRLAQATRSPPAENFSMTALHTIHLELDCQYHAVSNLPFLLTGRLGPTSRLRTLVIDFGPNAVSHAGGAAAALPLFSTNLEDVLCRPTYAALEHVVLLPPGGSSRRRRLVGDDLLAWQEDVRDQFPMLCERGILRC
ncbi:hypothetical protein TRAPUB_7483 [Trametes pubescens]|uniref:Uncharacterized protein n=1 Tax=Trametes pubescens TaxID=154538 RepID=A0A1M2V3E3_TRAPU|nr:hypothetical protein TRAPUB_7483 [Trametes pubescens]